jgi:pimeloyl-ACP methyl ester carboxylesterase
MTPMHVERTGRAGAPPMILVHGFAASNHSWRHWVPGLSEQWELHLVELAGFGRSTLPPDGTLGPLDQARHLGALIRELALDTPPVLVGHSLGGAVALAAALDMDRPPRAVVVVSGPVYPLKLPPYVSLMRKPGLGRLLALSAPPRWALRAGLRGIVHDPASVTPELVDGYRAPLLSSERRGWIVQAARQLSPRADAHALVPRYPELDAPLLALWGEEDPVVPAHFAERLARAVPRGEAVVLPRVGHLPPEEAPEASLDIVKDFLAREGEAP